jgi:hypothetical protein
VITAAERRRQRTGLTNVGLSGDVYDLEFAGRPSTWYTPTSAAAPSPTSRRPGGDGPGPPAGRHLAGCGTATAPPSLGSGRPRLDRWLELYRRSQPASAEADAGRHLLGWVLAAGFARPGPAARPGRSPIRPAEAWWGRFVGRPGGVVGLRQQAVPAAGRPGPSWPPSPTPGARGPPTRRLFAVLHAEVLARAGRSVTPAPVEDRAGLAGMTGSRSCQDGTTAPSGST